jgi:hypothetical protein
MPESHSPDALRLRRYRRCPKCQVVRPASEFRRAGGAASAPVFAQQRRQCPECGHVGPLMAFPITERPPEGSTS